MSAEIQTSVQETRRAEVIDAALRVILRDGASQASLRAIAHQLGTTIGVITHHFVNKDELMLEVMERLAGGLLKEAVESGNGLTGVAKLEKVLVTALPTNKRRAERWRQWVGLLGLITTRDKLLEAERAASRAFIAELETQLRSLQRDGTLEPSHDIVFEALRLMSLVDGLGVDAVLHPELYSRSVQEQAVRRHLDGLHQRPLGKRR
jgi:AcrR family transcriptional regulator